MMDEQLINEVQNHIVIYNRQKYFLNDMKRGRYQSKEDAWQNIARNLGTDVETCKKRWKYLRERYVQQRKQGDPPTYEHLSRPYLEKMTFLDQHIHPRKSYRNGPDLMPGQKNLTVSPFTEFMDSSRSNGSASNFMYRDFQDVKLETENIGHQNHINSQQSDPHNTRSRSQINPEILLSNMHAENAQRQSEQRETDYCYIASSSSSVKSSMSSRTVDVEQPGQLASKKSRSDIKATNDYNSSDNEELEQSSGNMQRDTNNSNDYQNDILHLANQRFLQIPTLPARTSEQLLGELVTAELLKMGRERRRKAQKRILEVLFFDD